MSCASPTFVDGIVNEFKRQYRGKTPSQREELFVETQALG
jgi:hypothetical protein